MNDWAMVTWSQARQVTDLLGIKGADAPRAGTTPAAWFESLKSGDRGNDAISFLGLALPRYEAIVWASQVMMRLGHAERDLDNMRAFEVAQQWIRDPSEKLRRQAFALADAMGDNTAEKLLLLAIYFSGGSIAPEDLQPVHPKEDITGHLTSTAVKLTVLNAADAGAAMREALAMGEALAQRPEA